MKFLTSTKESFHCLLVILTLAILSACSTTPSSPDDIPPALFSKLTNNSEFFLKKDELAAKQENSGWQFVAVQALIAEKKFTLANSIIEYLQSKTLSASDQASLNLLIADSLATQNRFDEAQQQLNTLDNTQLSELGIIYSLKLKAQLQIGKEDHLGASDSLLVLAPRLTTDEDKQQYNDLLLTQLSLLPLDVLNQYQAALDLTDQATEASEVDETTPITTAAEIDPFKEGWYALASLYKRYQLRSNQLIRELETWKKRYSAHPLLDFMPTQLTNIPESSPYQPENIAVLLPLSGRFQQQAEAVQYGLLHAFYSQQQGNKGANENAPLSVPKLHFYDTQTQSPEQITAQFKANNIDFVIGPLIKEEIDAFLPLLENIPVLALNNLTEQQAFETDKKAIAWHYAFPLSPEDEAKQAALLIAQDQHKKPLVIAPNSTYGQRVAQAFSEEWQRLNNTQAESHFFNNKAQLDDFIDDLLQTGKSKIRIAQMKAITDLPLEAEVRSRRDIDAIYIVSKRDELILIKPFIDVSISRFASTMPLYASSRSHLLDRGDKQNNELSNLVFSDSPFLLDADNKTFNEIEQAWGKQSFATLRLFALGFDSYQLIEQLMQLQNSEGYTYKGLVGQLSLDQTNTVQAKLSWAKYQQGKRIEVAAPISGE